MAAEYKWTVTDVTVQRIADTAFIPNDPNNMDWVRFQEWVTAGGVPDPADPPPAPPPVLDESQFDALPKTQRAMLVLMGYYMGKTLEQLKRDYHRAYTQHT